MSTGFRLLQVVYAEDVLGGTVVIAVSEVYCVYRNVYLPHEMPPVRHTPHRIHGPTALLEAEDTFRLASVVAELVNGVLVYGVVPPSGIEGVAIGTPARASTPWRRASVCGYGGDGRWHSSVPDADRAIERSVKERGAGLRRKICGLRLIGRRCGEWFVNVRMRASAICYWLFREVWLVC